VNDEQRRERARRLADLVSGWWYLRPGETLAEQAARIKADPRYPDLGQPIPGDDEDDEDR
jgi:hypothetical protein